MSTKLYLPGLNGLRAIAAMAVVFSHIGLNLDKFNLQKFSWDLAGYGVTIFFSLSGFLITYLLLLENAKDKTIHIKNFYVRRVLRIWPLYFFYLAISLLVIYFHDKSLLPGSLVFYIFLSANIPFILNCALPHLDHYWSLAVEEQFYLFWPWLVKKSNRLLKVLVTFITMMMILKFVFRYWEIKTGNGLPYLAISVTRFHCMAIGALGAYLYYDNNTWFLKCSQSVFMQILAWLNVGLLVINKFHIASIIDSEIVAITTVVLIINQVANQKTIISLEKPVFDFLGKISFGIYVYHPLIIAFVITTLPAMINSQNNLIKYLIVFLIIPLSTVFIAWLSYTFFEKRFLKIKGKYSTIHSAGSKVI